MEKLTNKQQIGYLSEYLAGQCWQIGYQIEVLDIPADTLSISYFFLDRDDRALLAMVPIVPLRPCPQAKIKIVPFGQIIPFPSHKLLQSTQLLPQATKIEIILYRRIIPFPPENTTHTK